MWRLRATYLSLRPTQTMSWFEHSQPRMKQTARRARSCPQAFPQRSKTTALAAGALTCPGLAPGFAYSYTKKTWRQHATCLTGPTKRAPRPSDKSNWTLVQFQPYQARVELFDFSIRNVVHEKPILAIGRPGRCDPIW